MRFYKLVHGKNNVREKESQRDKEGPTEILLEYIDDNLLRIQTVLEIFHMWQAGRLFVLRYT